MGGGCSVPEPVRASGGCGCRRRRGKRSRSGHAATGGAATGGRPLRRRRRARRRTAGAGGASRGLARGGRPSRGACGRPARGACGTARRGGRAAATHGAADALHRLADLALEPLHRLLECAEALVEVGDGQCLHQSLDRLDEVTPAGGSARGHALHSPLDARGYSCCPSCSRHVLWGLRWSDRRWIATVRVSDRTWKKHAPLCSSRIAWWMQWALSIEGPPYRDPRRRPRDCASGSRTTDRRSRVWLCDAPGGTVVDTGDSYEAASGGPLAWSPKRVRGVANGRGWAHGPPLPYSRAFGGSSQECGRWKRTSSRSTPTAS